jgi:short-subunit dehydrogenase
MFEAERYGPWAVLAGASEGIGGAFAHRIATAGINLVLIARNAGRLETFASELRQKTGVQIRTLASDLADAGILDHIRKATDDLEVGLLIFNAAAAGMRPLIEQSEEEALMAARVSVTTQTAVVQHFAKRMAPRGRGGIILMGSFAGNAGTPNLATYCGAKAYTQMFGEALWAELKPRGVDVLVLSVAAVDTPNRRRSGIGDTPGINVVTPEDVADQGLSNLADGGPVQVPPQQQALFDMLCLRPRRDVVSMMMASDPTHKKT